MPPPGNTAPEPAHFSTVDHSPDPAAMIAMLDSFQPVYRKAESVLLDRLFPETARTALDVGCGTGDDLVALAGRMPPNARAEGVDTSEAMLAEAGRRADAAGADGVTFRYGDALSLPYADQVFDICRVKMMLMHVADPLRVVREMVRVTRPGGRAGAFETDVGSLLTGHPDQELTGTIVDAVAGSMAQPRIGRHLQALFREAGLTSLTVDPIALTVPQTALGAVCGPAVARLRQGGVLSAAQAGEWWSWLAAQDRTGGYTSCVTVFVVTGTRPR